MNGVQPILEAAALLARMVGAGFVMTLIVAAVALAITIFAMRR